ncbi:MAG TPA: MaoC/PaaZ C-terminal domain-containing protein [Kofleriaceae bacterium]|nr:MaoC/PaaZ C-terminal domain-containing protein [Kofleriaceae bacterium]
MPFDLSILGKSSAVHRHRYRWNDAVLYALAVGAGERELAYLYEGAGRKVLPSYAVVPTLEPCRELLGRLAGGFGDLVHRYQRLVVHAELPPEGELDTVGQIVDVCGHGAMAEVTGRTQTRTIAGELVAETEFSVIYRTADVVTTGPSARRRKHVAPATPPEFRAQERTLPIQSLLYRLSGDDNPIHADPEAARKTGFPRPILHGLCTFGYVCRAVLRARPDRRLRALEAEFRKPAYPGDTLDIHGWPDGASVVMQVTTTDRPTETVLQGVRAELS